MRDTLFVSYNPVTTNVHPSQAFLLIILSILSTGLNCYTIGAESFKLHPSPKYNESIESNACQK